MHRSTSIRTQHDICSDVEVPYLRSSFSKTFSAHSSKIFSATCDSPAVCAVYMCVYTTYINLFVYCPDPNTQKPLLLSPSSFHKHRQLSIPIPLPEWPILNKKIEEIKNFSTVQPSFRFLLFGSTVTNANNIFGEERYLQISLINIIIMFQELC